MHTTNANSTVVAAAVDSNQPVGLLSSFMPGVAWNVVCAVIQFCKAQRKSVARLLLASSLSSRISLKYSDVIIRIVGHCNRSRPGRKQKQIGGGRGGDGDEEEVGFPSQPLRCIPVSICMTTGIVHLSVHLIRWRLRPVEAAKNPYYKAPTWIVRYANIHTFE